MAEQKHPEGAPGVWKKPNFGLIVALSAIFILIALVAAYLFAKKDGRDLVPRTRQGALCIPSLPAAVGRRSPHHIAV